MNSAPLLALALALLPIGCGDDGHPAVAGGGWSRSAQLDCSLSAAGCACPGEGKAMACGQTVERQGDVVTCRTGSRSCEDGRWSECIGTATHEQYAPLGGSGLRTLGLAQQSTDCEEPCDPRCNYFADDAAGLSVPDGLSADSGGVTLEGGSSAGGNCPELMISPQNPTITVTAIAADGTITAADNPLAMAASCGGSAVSPSWAMAANDGATVDSEAGLATVFDAIAGEYTVTASSAVSTADTTLTVKVDVREIEVGVSSAVVAEFEAAGAGSDPMVTLYPYANTVFPLDLQAPLVQWSSGGVASSQVQVALRYPVGAAQPLFWYSKIFSGADQPRDGSVAGNVPAWQIPQEIWSAFDRSAAGDVAEIVIQRRYGGSVKVEKSIPVRFASEALRGTVYYTQYLRTLYTPGSSDVCGGSGQPDINPSTYTPSPSNVCPTGNCTHVSSLGTSTTRAIDLADPTAPNTDPFAGTAGCPVCHSVSANGNLYVSGGQNWQTWNGGSSKGINTIGLSSSGDPTFSAPRRDVPNYGNVTTGEASGEDSRGFSYAAITPDGAYVLQGANFWGNTKNPGTSNNLQDNVYKGIANRAKPYFFVKTARPSNSVQFATTAALAAHGRSGSPTGTTLTESSTSNNAALAIDGVTMANGYTVLIKDETGTSARDNGVYTVTNNGAGTAQWALTRVSWADSAAELLLDTELRVTDGNSNVGKIYKVSTAPTTAWSSSVALTQVSTGTLPNMMAPVISPDGTKLAYVNADADTAGSNSTGWRRGLTLLTFEQSTLAVSNKKRLISSWAPGSAGVPLKWPFFESDSESLLYVETHSNEYCDSWSNAGTCGTVSGSGVNSVCTSSSGTTVNSDIERACYQSAYGNMSPTTRGFWPGKIMSLSTSSTNGNASSGVFTPSTRVELANMTDGEQAEDADKAYQPTVLPMAVGGYRWAIFTSPRSYGNQFNQSGTHFSCGASMLWVAAIDDRAADGSDRSHRAFFLPGQQLAPITDQTHYVNERGYLVPSQCEALGTGCDVSDECCGSADGSVACRVPSGWQAADGPPARTCQTVQPGCSEVGEYCEDASDCCGGAPCVNFACEPKPTYQPATFTRDYSVSCPVDYLPRWREFNFNLTTASTSSISFSVRTASSQGGLDAAQSVTLGTSTASNVDVDVPESYDVGTALAAAGAATELGWLRVAITFTPSTDHGVAPILHRWEQRYTCVPGL